MECPKCNFDNREGAKFCLECGKELESRCPQCGKKLPLAAKFCDECGHDLSKPKVAPTIDYQQPSSYTPKFLADKILTSRSSIEGERKIVTVLFADVAGFTSMSEKLDPEDVHEIMDGCFRILMDEIHRFEGTVNEFRGDGLMALFGAPIAHEDHAQRACHAALAAQNELSHYSEKLKKEHGVDFKMRIGMNSGAVLVGAIGDDLRMDYTAQGDTANLAARMETNAEPGKALVSENTFRLARDYFEFRPVGKLQVKGKEMPQEAYVLLSPTDIETRIEASVARGLKELVGRDDALEFLLRAFERVKQGEAQVIDVVGEAGIGKSRLVYEFTKALGGEATILTGTCAHYGRNINFLPVVDIVRAAFGIKEGMTEDEVGDLITKRAVNGLAPMVSFYRNILSLTVDDAMFKMLDAEGRKYGTFEAVKNLLIAISVEKPLVVFLEDVHWIDKISEELFSFFARCIHDHPILMLSAYRPEGSPPWAQGVHYQRLGLETLSAKASIRLVRNMVGGLPLDPDLEQKIVSKTGGNPFFVEEIVGELLDRGDIVKKGDQYVCLRPIDQLEIPNTIQGVLSARMDRLSEDLKQTMQVASVIGRDFAFRILKSIMALGDELRAHLTNLVGLEILYEKALYPELEYIFKHALTQEVAYESLLKQRRREIHGRIAQTIEELYPERLEEHYEMLAHHYERSGNSEKAIEYLMLAADKSNQQAAVQAARMFSEQALDLARSVRASLDPELEARLLEQRSRAIVHIGEIDSAVEGFKSIIEISRKHGLTKYERKAIRAVVTLAFMFNSEKETWRTLEEAIAWARERDDKALESIAISNKGFCLAATGEAAQGYQLTVDAEQLALGTGKPLPIFSSRLLRSVVERWMGRPAEAVELTEGMVEILYRRYALSTLPATIQFRGIALAEIGRIKEAITIIKTGIDLCEKFGAFQRLGALYNCLGYCYGELQLNKNALPLNIRSEEIGRGILAKCISGRRSPAEIIAQAFVNMMENLFNEGELDKVWDRIESFQKESANEEYNAARYIWEGRMHYLQAQIMLIWNEVDKASSFIEYNLANMRKTKSRKREGGFFRLLGEVQIRRGEHDNAISSISNAVTILKGVGNPRQLWLAHNSLASAYDKMGRHGEAREQWGAAAEVIQDVANGLSDRELREGFIKAEPVRNILSKAQL